MSNPSIVQNDLTYALDKTIREVGIISANGLVKNEGKVRFIITGSGISNLIRVTARIIGQEDWTPLVDLTGNVNQLVDVFTWDFLRVECVVYDAVSDSVKLQASSFNSSAIGGIEVPGGDMVSNFDTISFTSSDSSITITGDPLTGEIDFISSVAGGVTSVNTRTGDVVLDKTDVNLGDVDNTSDADKPISDDTQDALDALDDRIIPIEDRAEVLTVYAYENNTQVYADGQPGIKDPSALIRDGWYFKNSIAGQKINWYYFDGTSQGNITLGDFKSAYTIMTFDAVSGAASPIIAIYTFPTGAGDVIPGFAHSRIVYDGPMTPTPVVGKQYLVYAGENPPVRQDLPRINLTLITGSSIGDKLPTEQILTVSFGSNSAASVNSVQYMVETLGLFSDPVKHEMDLRIRVASQNALDLKVAKAGDTMSGLLDITVTGAAALEANDIVIGNPWGAGYSVITGKDGSTDALYIQSADQLGTFAGNSSKPVTVGSGYTQGANSGDVEVLSAPAAVSGASGSVYIHSGDTVGATGFTTVKSGNSSSSSTGTAVLRSGDAAVSSGNTQVRSGNSVGNSGVTSLFSGQSSGANSGQVQVQSGAAAVASGNILISSGSAATRGLVQIDGSKLDMLTSIDMNSSKITELLDPTDNQDAATKKYVDDKDALKQSLIDKNQANGYVGLNGSTKIDSIYLPSYVDDVLEFGF